MSSVIFVHGISIRYPALAQSLGQCEAKLKEFLPGYKLRFVAWGDHLGTPHWEVLKSIPNYFDRGGTQDDAAPATQSALWALLYRDPLFELRLLNSQQAPPAAPSFGQQSPGAELAGRLSALELKGDTSTLLAEAGLADSFDKARDYVMNSAEFTEMQEKAAPPLAPFRRAIARALLAQSAIEAMQSGFPKFCLSQELRERLTADLVDALGGLEGAMPPWLVKKFLAVGMDQLSKNFGKLARDYYQLIGDILVYQARGASIRAAIQEELKNAEGRYCQ
jgi:hypothetical protein